MASWDYGGLRANTCLFHQETWGHFFYTQPNKRQPPPPPTALLLLTPCNSFAATNTPPTYSPARTHARTHACLGGRTRVGHTQMDAHPTPPPGPQTVRVVGVLGEEFNSEWVALQVAGISCLGVNVRQKDKDGHFTGHWLLLPADQWPALALYRGGRRGEGLSHAALKLHQRKCCRRARSFLLLLPWQAVLSMGAASSQHRILMFAAVHLPMLSSLVFYTALVLSASRRNRIRAARGSH